MKPAHVRRVTAGTAAGALLAAGGLLATATPAQAATPADDRAYLTSENDNAVTVYDTTDNSVVTTITNPGFDNPEGIAVSPAGTEAWMANNGGTGTNLIYIIDTATNTVDGSITGTDRFPFDVVFSPDGATAYVSYDRAAGRVDVIDTATRTVTDSIMGGVNTRELAITPDGATVYAASAGDDNIIAIDTATATVAATIDSGSDTGIGEIDINAAGTQLWVPYRGTSVFGIVDTATNAFSGGLDWPSPPRAIGFSPVDAWAYIPSTDGVLRSFETGVGIPGDSLAEFGFASSDAVEVSSDGAKVYVVDNGDDLMFVVDAETMTLDESVSTPNGPNEVALGPVTPPTPAQADIGIDLAASTGLLSSQINYNLTVDNDGPNDATGVQVVVDLPTQTSSVSGLPAACTYNSSSDEVTCNYALISAGGSRAPSFKATMGLLSIGQLPASATRVASSPADPNPANDTNTANCTVLTSLIITCS